MKSLEFTPQIILCLCGYMFCFGALVGMLIVLTAK
jgi:hypothetical protein